MVKSIWVIVGKCSISVNDLYFLSIEELADITEGWFEGQKAEWERTRELAYWSFLPHAKNPRRLKKTDIMKFNWDEFKKMDEKKKSELKDHGARLVALYQNGMISPKEKTKTPETK